MPVFFGVKFRRRPKKCRYLFDDFYLSVMGKNWGSLWMNYFTKVSVSLPLKTRYDV